MLLVLYILIFSLLNAYVIWRTLRWMRHCNEVFSVIKYRFFLIIVLCLFSSIIIISYFLIEHPQFSFLHGLSSRWFGILFYIIFYIAIADIVRLLTKLVLKVFFKGKHEDIFKTKKIILPGGLLVVLLVGVTSIYGFIHVDKLHTVTYEATINKSVANIESMRIVMVADHHLGYILGADYMEEMVEKINELKPDIVCFAGDIFDNSFDSLDNPNAIRDAWLKIESKYGVYACWGNHDVTEALFSGFSVGSRKDALRDSRMDKLLKDSNIIALGDETVLIDNSFYMIGRLDYQKAGDGTNNRMTITELTQNLDLSKPVLLMDHQPRDLGDVANAGVDIDLSGHTHSGQMFPMNFTNKVEWENNYGFYKKGDMFSIVTSGIGVYGPAMRVMTNSEVVAIDVTFDGNK